MQLRCFHHQYSSVSGKPTFSTQSANNGYEYALALLGGALAVLIEGAGKLSLDRVISR
ncbi:DoxD-like protein [Pseudomonas savastanoi pv. glycinea]|nr:DoxD-like family protein [Pseudomonas savastanoi pv. phaseolicola]KPB70908.1 DoxD-like family protein [Pseudomonas amygdali pv. mellea]KPB80943.1 DoxD-like family protein [Pseudomonas syringae pv. maculicola]RMM88060.1 DoxD-like protein [Pseudomonas savastanoi pv. glycinea]KPB43630.1 DoxD-like family protein [Pseudomonas savastanoi pv. phaseolicola]